MHSHLTAIVAETHIGDLRRSAAQERRGSKPRSRPRVGVRFRRIVIRHAPAVGSR